MLIDPARSVHTIGMRFAIDVAHCDRRLRVLKVRSMARHRLGLPVLRSRVVIEAEKGSFKRWGLEPAEFIDSRVRFWFGVLESPISLLGYGSRVSSGRTSR